MIAFKASDFSGIIVRYGLLSDFMCGFLSMVSWSTNQLEKLLTVGYIGAT